MMKFATVALSVLLAFMARHASATCYPQRVLTECPSGQISSALIPGGGTGTGTSTASPLIVAGSNVQIIKRTATGTSTAATATTSSIDPRTDTATINVTGAGASTATVTLSDSDGTRTMAVPGTWTMSYVTSGWVANTLTNYATTASLTAVLTSKMDSTVTHLSGDIAVADATGFAMTTDPRLSDARAPTGTLYTISPVFVNTDTSTVTSTNTANALSSTGLTIGVRPVSASGPGLAPTLDGVATHYLDGSGAFSAPAAVAAVSYTVDYDATLSAIATATFTTTVTGTGTSTTAATIDGKAAVIGNINNAQSATLDGSTGLYIRASTTNTNDSGSTLNAPYVSWPLSSFITSIWETQDIWVWVAHQYVRTPAANYDRNESGIAYTSAGVLATTGWRIRIINQYNTSLSGNYGRNVLMNTSPGVASDYNKGGLTGTISNANNVSVYHIINHVQVHAFYGALDVGGNWPAKSALTFLAATNLGAVGVNGGIIAIVDPAVFAAAVPQNTNGNADVLVKKLKVEHR